VNEHDELVERAAASCHTVVLIGGLDSGKTTLGKAVARSAIDTGRAAAFLDADVGQSSVGPPTTVGLKLIRSVGDLETEAFAKSDALYFVGATSPQGNLLSVATGTARLLQVARSSGAEIVVIDTSGMVSGIYGQLLKYHKLELIQPDLVVGLQRGEELDPLLGIVRRFFGTAVETLSIHPEARPTSVEQRAANRDEAMRRYFEQPLQRWRVKPTVFMPTLPALFDLSQLDRLVVGLSDGEGSYLGIGYLEHSPDDGVLRLISPVAEAPKALRLGSVRLEDGYRAKRVDLRNLFGTD
jgi:polynucleotide 5'-kinase involved in rRNA processing